MARFRHVASMLTVGAGVASLSVLSATGVGAQAGGGSNSTNNSDNNNNNTTQSNSASTSGKCSPIQQQNNRDINNSNDTNGGDAGKGGKGGNGSPSEILNIPILSPGTGNGNSGGGNGGAGGNGGNAHGSANAGNQVQIVSNCGNTTINPTSTVTVQARAAAPVVSTAHFTG